MNRDPPVAILRQIDQDTQRIVRMERQPHGAPRTIMVASCPSGVVILIHAPEMDAGGPA